MKGKTKIYAIAALVCVFMLTLLYFIYSTYNLNKKLRNDTDTAEKNFNDYSKILIGYLEDYNRETEYLRELHLDYAANKELHDQTHGSYNHAFPYGTLTWSGINCFSLLCCLRVNDENKEKIKNLEFKYRDAILTQSSYYESRFKKLDNYQNITTLQFDSLINYNNEAIKIVKELRQVK